MRNWAMATLNQGSETRRCTPRSTPQSQRKRVTAEQAGAMPSAAMQTRAPGSANKSPLNKENREATLDKRRKVGRDIFGVRVTPEPRVRVRQAFSAVNRGAPITVAQESSPTPSRVAGDEGTPVAMTKGDIEALLDEKMKGKNKFDFKGKSEQMMEYIKKLRACIRCLQASEAAYILEKQLLQSQLLEGRECHTQKENFLRSKQEELEKGLSELKVTNAALENKLCHAEAQKEALLLERAKDANTLQTANKEIARLTEESDQHCREFDSASQQVASLQDINRRLQEYNSNLQLYNSKLQSEASVNAEALSKSQKEKTAIMETLSKLRGHSVAVQEQLDQAKVSVREGAVLRKLLNDEEEKLRMELQEALVNSKQLAVQCENLAFENNKYKECTEKSAMELERLSSKVTALENNYALQMEETDNLCQQLELAHHKLQMADTLMVQHRNEGAEHMAIMEDLQKRLSEAELRVREGDLLRRRLHNTILELKGNIRVFCRVRPLLPDDEGFEAEELPVLQYPTSTDLLGRGIEIVQNQGQKYAFTFDKVYGPDAGQGDVFLEISQLIQSALDGYKVCIFAYGQTGSGKTYTMLGNPDDPSQRGVIPRSLKQIFKASQELRSQGWSFQMQASMLEIYNETIRDLLSTKPDTPVKQYSVKHDQNRSTSVSDLTVVEVKKWREVSSLLQRAAQSRAVSKTALNEQSSRSHCVFTLRILGYNESIDQQVQGVLNLIDLAGSERLSRSGSIGDRLKETQAINKSLASLGDVILAIANREQHIPYRNSKLTYLLQPCLGGDSKTLMIVNISPDAKSANESLCSLRFAAKVNACEIGVPRRTAS